jgi:TolA-binding protein
VGILTNTSDYTLAIRELEAIKALTPALRGAYQKVCLFKAEQLIQEGKTPDAQILLDKSLKQPVDKSIEARAYFWKGEYAHSNNNYAESIKWYNQYFAAAAFAVSLPVSQSIPIAQYAQGYNYLRMSNYPEAQKQFEESVKGIESLPVNPGQVGLIKNQIYPDAILRAGDCAFKRNQYDKANAFYDQSIRYKYTGHDYAEYQEAIIKGLQKLPLEKIRLMEELAHDMPESQWADDALYQAGNTYQDENLMSKAIQAYEQLVNQYKQKSSLLLPALLRLGLLSYNSNQFEAS